MGITIINGNGSPRAAEVTADFQLKVQAEVQELQHFEALSGLTYQVSSTDTGITAKTQTILHLKNIDPERNCVISFIRMQAITNTASKPVVGEYFEIGMGETVASGGTATTPTNTNAASGNIASVTATGIDPTMAGTFTQIDKWYNVGNGQIVYNKQGSIILGLNDTLSIRLLSAGTGEAYARITFMMIKP